MTETYKLKILRWLNRQVSAVDHREVKLTKTRTLMNIAISNIHIDSYENFKDVVEVISEYEVGSYIIFDTWTDDIDYVGRATIRYRGVNVLYVLDDLEWEDFQKWVQQKQIKLEKY